MDRKSNVYVKLKKVPLQLRLKILENVRKQRGLSYLDAIFHVGITGAISFDRSREGASFWRTRAEKIDKCLE